MWWYIYVAWLHVTMETYIFCFLRHIAWLLVVFLCIHIVGFWLCMNVVFLVEFAMHVIYFHCQIQYADMCLFTYSTPLGQNLVNFFKIPVDFHVFWVRENVYHVLLNVFQYKLCLWKADYNRWITFMKGKKRQQCILDLSSPIYYWSNPSRLLFKCKKKKKAE